MKKSSSLGNVLESAADAACSRTCVVDNHCPLVLHSAIMGCSSANQHKCALTTLHCGCAGQKAQSGWRVYSVFLS